MTIEVLSRRPCPKCGGKYGSAYVEDGNIARWLMCPCTDELNPAGAGFEIQWATVTVPDNAVTVTDEVVSS